MSAAVAHALPPSILALFAPRPPLEYKKPIEKRKMPPFTTVASYVKEFEDPVDTPPPLEEKVVESAEERRARKKLAKEEAHLAKIEAEVETYDPSKDPKLGEGDPYKTLFVARIAYETTEATLMEAFQQFGPIKSCKLVRDSATGKPRGYGFIEFEHERDMKTAY